jgi:hypothetical protein
VFFQSFIKKLADKTLNNRILHSFLRLNEV